MNDAQIVPVSQTAQPLAQVQPSIDIERVIQAAITAGRPMSELKEALDLFERMEAIRRESLFNAAFTAFKRDCPPIARRTQDEYIMVTRNGVRRPRMYASLDDISATCDPRLHRNGLTYDWTDAELTPDGCIVRRFVLRHVAGHSRKPVASPPIPIEGGAAHKALDPNRKATSASPQQRLGVADTYAKRYSMTSGLGIPTCDEDTDSVINGGGEPITQEQVRHLNDLIIEIGPQFREPLLRFLTAQLKRSIATLDAIPASEFDLCVEKLESKRAKA